MARSLSMPTTGVRPGEKMHEILVSEEEMHHCVRRGDYYTIRSMLPELLGDAAPEKNAHNREFSSADHVLDLEGTRALLRKHGLLEASMLAQTAELLK